MKPATVKGTALKNHATSSLHPWPKKSYKVFPKPLKNHGKWSLISQEFNSSRKLYFCNTFHSKTLFQEAHACRCRHKNWYAKLPGTKQRDIRSILSFCAYTTFSTELPNRFKIDQMSTQDFQTSFLMLPQFPTMIPKFQNGLPGCKNKRTSPPKPLVLAPKMITIFWFAFPRN